MAQSHLKDTRPSVLVVDDEELMRNMIAETTAGEGLVTVAAGSVADAIAHAQRRQFDVLVTDLTMPGQSGIELIRHFRRFSAGTSVIVVTGYPDGERVRQAEELEITSFLVKPFTPRQVRYSLLQALEKRRTFRENAATTVAVEANSDLGLVGASRYIRDLRKQVLLMAQGDFPVLVLGCSGSGKEVVAHAIHASSARKEKTLIPINCAAIPHHLEESEFFGHAKGAFTGAYGSKAGIMESADGSTLFLDEIGELSLGIQAKLLRVLDTGEFTRVGEAFPRKVDIRIISATNRDLEAMVGKGTFREDLYYRLKGARIQTEPLRKHADDIPILVRHFLNEYSPGKEITAEAMRLLSDFEWPGNIRELIQTIRYVCAVSRDHYRINSAAVQAALELEEAGCSVDYYQAKKSFDVAYFEGLLRKHGGNATQVAREANMHRPNLIRKLKELGLSAADFRGGSGS